MLFPKKGRILRFDWLGVEVMRVSRFSSVGLLASAVHVLVAGLIFLGFPQAHEVAVNLISYCCAFLVSLIGHQRYTFKRRARLFRFLMMSWFGLLINNITLLAALKFGVVGVPAIAIAVVLAAVAGYLLARFWVFEVPTCR